jgi:hypothetical protein
LKHATSNIVRFPWRPCPGRLREVARRLIVADAYSDAIDLRHGRTNNHGNISG